MYRTTRDGVGAGALLFAQSRGGLDGGERGLRADIRLAASRRRGQHVARARHVVHGSAR
jgi:hypothetical protein